MAMNTTTGRAYQPMEDNHPRELNTVDARGGVASGRVVIVLAASLSLMVVVFAMLWLTGV